MRHEPGALRCTRTLLFVAGLGLLLAGCGVNNIPTYQEEAKAKWSQVLNQYQRRAELIPNLVETVKGYAAQERQVLEEVIDARARATQMQVQIPADVVTNPEAFKRFQEAQAPAHRGARAADRGLGALSRSQIEPEFSCAAIAARGHGEPHRGCAARLHRGGAAIQHGAADVSRTALGVDALSQQQADGDIHRRRGRDQSAAGEVLTRTCERRARL